MKVNRMKLVLNEIKKKKIVSVNDLAKKFNVTRMTINRDLTLLEREKLIEKTHGGALLKEVNLNELAHIEKKSLYIAEKKEIAETAAKIIQNGENIFIGPGTTTELILKYIHDKRIRVFTNSIFIFNQFKHLDNIELILIGGKLRHISGALIGKYAMIMLDFIEIDKCFLGANGIKDDSISIFSDIEAEFQMKVLKISKEKYFLMDNNKFDKRDIYHFVSTSEINAIITDSNISNELKEHYSKFIKLIYKNK